MAATSARKVEPWAPSASRWSKETDKVVTQRGSIRSSAPVSDDPGLGGQSGRHRECRIPLDSEIGAPASTPKTPMLVIENVPPAMSAG